MNKKKMKKREKFLNKRNASGYYMKSIYTLDSKMKIVYDEENIIGKREKEIAILTSRDLN